MTGARPASLAHCDYAANGGDGGGRDCSGGPSSYAQGMTPSFWPSYLSGVGEIHDGVTQPYGLVRAGAIKTGMSNLLMVAERYLDIDNYYNGNDPADDQGWDLGYDYDVNRWANSNFPPMQDTAGIESEQAFGSAHPNGFAAVLCDGSVHSLSFAINPKLLGEMANRNNTVAIDPTQIQ